MHQTIETYFKKVVRPACILDHKHERLRYISRYRSVFKDSKGDRKIYDVIYSPVYIFSPGIKLIDKLENCISPCIFFKVQEDTVLQTTLGIYSELLNKTVSKINTLKCHGVRAGIESEEYGIIKIFLEGEKHFEIIFYHLHSANSFVVGQNCWEQMERLSEILNINWEVEDGGIKKLTAFS